MRGARVTTRILKRGRTDLSDLAGKDLIAGERPVTHSFQKERLVPLEDNWERV